MRKLSTTLVGLLVLALGARLAPASRYDPHNVPVDAKWVIHVDVDAAQQTELGKVLRQRLEANPEFVQKARDFQTFTGTRLLEDVHSILLYGREFAGPQSVLLIHAALDQERLTLNMRQLKPDFGSQFYRGQTEIVSWTDNDRKVYACFYKPTVTLVSQSYDEITNAVDVLDGKSPSLKPGSLLAAEPGDGTILYLVSDKLKELSRTQHDKPSPIARSADAGSVTFGVSGSRLFLKGMLVSPTSDLANQTRMALNGLRAIFVLSQSRTESPDPKVQALIEMVRDASVDVRDRIVNVQVTLNVSTVLQLLPPELGGGQPAPANAADRPK